MGKDVILDRYARLYAIPYQLARLGHDVSAFCLDYHAQTAGDWTHDAAPGVLHWQSYALGALRVPALLSYPSHILGKLRAFAPEVIIGASDIPHAALARWLARRLGVPYAVDLYDNFEGFGQAKLPGLVFLLRQAVREAGLVTTTSEPLRRKVLADGARGRVIALPSSVELAVFARGDKAAARAKLGLPADVPLLGTAGGLYREKGIAPLYRAWEQIAAVNPNVQLVLAGPLESGFPPPRGERVHYLGQLAHAQVADLFRALDVGVISILDTPFGRYSFPQKAYEMLACGLPVVATGVGAMLDLFSSTPQVLCAPDDASSLAAAVLQQLAEPVSTEVAILDWAELIASIEPALCALVTDAY